MRIKKDLRLPDYHFGDYMLREIKLKDWQDMYAYGSDPQVTKYLNWGPFISPSEARKSIKTIFFPRVKEGIPVGYAIIDKINNRMIGTIDFHTPREDGSKEIGFALNRNYWNRGIMSHALLYLIDLGFNHFHYDKLIIRHMADNEQSERVIKKTPFRMKPNTLYHLKKRKDNRLITLKNYELTKEEYHEYQQSQGHL